MPKTSAFFETTDGARIYYEEQGRGRPIILLHGWLCSSKFFIKNVEELAKEFRVVTPDFRGHGGSSKILSGHTVDRYADDVRDLIVHLDLKDAVLAGWSLAASVVLAYWKKYSKDSRLKGLGIVDGAPAPFNPGDWNSHGLRGNNADGMNGAIKAFAADPKQFAWNFANNMFKGAKAPEQDREWLAGEIMKTPVWIGSAIYSDFCIADYAAVLPTVTVPSFVFAADSNVYKKGVKMGEFMASEMKGKFVAFDAGHPLFFELPEKFNRELADFVRGL